MIEGNKFLAGLIAGAAIGTVAGVLLAAKPGMETREELKERASQLGDKAKTRFNSMFRRGEGQEESDASSSASDSARRNY